MQDDIYIERYVYIEIRMYIYIYLYVFCIRDCAYVMVGEIL